MLDQIKRLFKRIGRAFLRVRAVLLRKVIWVNPEGSDETGTGTRQKPFRTMQRALDEVPPIMDRDHVIKLSKGIHRFDGNFIVNRITKLCSMLVFSGDKREKTWIGVKKPPVELTGEVELGRE